MRNKLPETEYVLIKEELLADLEPPRAIARRFNRSTETLRRIRHSSDFEDYRRIQKSKMAPYRKPKEGNTPAEAPDGSDLIDSLRARQAAMNAHFDAVIAALERS